MELRKIYTDKDPCLRKISNEVTLPLSNEDLETANYLLEHLKFAANPINAEKYNLEPGVGLAAPQIGVNKRMFAIYIEYRNEKDELEDTLELILINPKIIAHSLRKSYLKGGEGCLSVPERKEGYVPRYADITISAYSLTHKDFIKMKLRGYEAIVFQHEYDHLDAILYYDHINKNNPYTKIEGALEI